MSDKIKQSYQQSKDIYDDVLTQSKWWSRLYIKLFWGGVDDNEIARRVLRFIPDDFAGKLLDVPVYRRVYLEKVSGPESRFYHMSGLQRGHAGPGEGAFCESRTNECGDDTGRCRKTPFCR